MKRWLVVGLLATLVLPLPSAVAEGLAAVPGSMDLGRLAPGAERDVEVRLENRGDRPVAVTADFSMRRSHAADAAAWLTLPEAGMTVPARGEAVVVARVHVPADAHSGAYLAYLTLRQAAEERAGSHARPGISVPVSFVVSGVDAWGRLNLPAAVEPGPTLTTAATTLANRLDRPVVARALVEVVRRGDVVQTWESPDVALKVDESRVVPLEVPTLGLAAGPHEVRVSASYEERGTRRVSSPILHDLWIGPRWVEVVSFHLAFASSTMDLPPGATQAIPANAPWSLDVVVRPMTPDAAPGAFRVRVGDQEFAAEPAWSAAPDRVALAVRGLGPLSAGPATIEFLQGGPGAWQTTATLDLVAMRPRVVVDDIVLTPGRLTAQVTSPDFDLDATLVLQLRTRAGAVAWTSHERFWLPRGQAVPLDVDLDLASAGYRLEWALEGDGDLSLQGTPRVAAPAASPLGPALVLLAAVAAGGAAALFVVRTRRAGTRPPTTTTAAPAAAAVPRAVLLLPPTGPSGEDADLSQALVQLDLALSAFRWAFQGDAAPAPPPHGAPEANEAGAGA